jgi:hypothetical protein
LRQPYVFLPRLRPVCPLPLPAVTSRSHYIGDKMAATVLEGRGGSKQI